MKKKSFVIICTWLIIAAATPLSATSESNGETDNRFKGVSVIDSPIETIYGVLKNTPSHSRWMTYCSKSSVVKTLRSNQLIQYYSFELPWPFKDRDMVVETTMTKEDGSGRILIESHAIESPSVPVPENNVRITEFSHQWILDKITPGKTMVTYHHTTAVGGLIPSAIKNLIAREIPLLTLKGLKNEATGKLSSKTRSRSGNAA